METTEIARTEASIFTKQRELKREAIRIYELKFRNFNNIELITILNPDENFISAIKNLEKKSIYYKIINFDGLPCYIIYKDFHFYEPEKKAISEGSDAVYIGRSTEKTQGLLLQYLAPHSKTSRHLHRKRTDIFHNLEGRCFIDLDDKQILLDKNTYKVTPPKIHQLHTADSASLNLLEIISDPKGLSVSDHYYVEYAETGDEESEKEKIKNKFRK